LITKKQVLRIYNQCLDIANKSELHIQMGCIITDKKGNLISSGYNTYKEHPLQSKYKYRQDALGMHAEISALFPIWKENLSSSILFVFRKPRSKVGYNSRPCSGCMKAIKEKQIKIIYYCDRYGNIIKEENLGTEIIKESIK
jgi:deoxycytidylate deaminase